MRGGRAKTHEWCTVPFTVWRRTTRIVRDKSSSAIDVNPGYSEPSKTYMCIHNQHGSAVDHMGAHTYRRASRGEKSQTTAYQARRVRKTERKSYFIFLLYGYYAQKKSSTANQDKERRARPIETRPKPSKLYARRNFRWFEGFDTA